MNERSSEFHDDPPATRPAVVVAASQPGRLGQATRRCWAILRLTGTKFFQIEGAQWASAFAFNAFCSLLPLILLLVTLASLLVDWDRAGNEVSVNPLYGAFGGIMALLLWIYVSGCIFIFGASLCAGRAEALRQPAETTTAAILVGVNTP